MPRTLSNFRKAAIHAGHPAFRPLALLAGAVLAAAVLVGCAGEVGDMQRERVITFVCAGGASFRVLYHDRRARITTDSAAYDLPSRPSSIGRKYTDGQTYFIHDEDRAALNGADGGPFRRCQEI
jgi:hypothetical protein